MKYMYINDETGTIKTHFIKRNRALAKLQRDAVVINQFKNICYIADCSSGVADRLLSPLMSL